MMVVLILQKNWSIANAHGGTLDFWKNTMMKKHQNKYNYVVSCINLHITCCAKSSFFIICFPHFWMLVLRYVDWARDIRQFVDEELGRPEFKEFLASNDYNDMMDIAKTEADDLITSLAKKTRLCLKHHKSQPGPLKERLHDQHQDFQQVLSKFLYKCKISIILNLWS